MTLAILTAKLKKATGRSAAQLGGVIRIFQPETVLKWHRELVRWKWSYPRKNKGGRPRTEREMERLIVRFARENSGWGYGKIQGELLKLGFETSETSISNILKKHNIPPVSVRKSSISWRHLMNHYKEQLLACDFFTVETLRLQTLYVLFYIELGTRQVYLAGVTANPDGFWVAQQARQYVWHLEERQAHPRFLIRDNDKKFTDAHDTVFRSKEMRLIRTPFRAPNANAYAERWVRTVREEGLDHLLVINEGHLRHVLKTFIDYYNESRPHQGLEQQMPIPPQHPIVTTGPVQRNKVLGFISDYYRGSEPVAICPT
jgi:transposase InsO family protein